MTGPGTSGIAGLADECDVIVVGAGPAGLSAATTAAASEARTLLVDENHTPGGQIYRAILRAQAADRRRLGEDYWRGKDIAEEFLRSRSEYSPATTVWSVECLHDDGGQVIGHEVGLSSNGAARLIRAKHVVLATGAMERPFPIPGWTLTGVMTAGAAQIALKTSGLIPSGNVVLAGTGPLLYLLAAQLLEAGATLAAVLDTTPRNNWSRAWRHVPAFAASSYIAKGLKLLRTVRSRTRIVRRVTALAAQGEGALQEIAWRAGGREHRMAADVLLLHQGIVPNINLSNAIGCEHVWDDIRLAFRPRVDEWFASSVPRLSIAGDGAGIGGAEAAALQGRIAALGCLARLGFVTSAERDRFAVPFRSALSRAMRGRLFLDELYRPAKSFRVPQDADTVVCRCEEISAGQVRAAAGQGAAGPNQMKVFLRCGMGPCQGRFCGLTVTELIAEERGRRPTEIGYFRLRFPIKPLKLRALAGLPQSEAAKSAVLADLADTHNPALSDDG